jgi:uncharacterized repeat protein (TIGR03837 family)
MRQDHAMDQPTLPALPAAPLSSTTAWRWDVFCRVIDNLGDIGVCWRLCANLAARGQRVRLWIDQPGALDWMAPGALEGTWPGIEVHPWDKPVPSEAPAEDAVADVWVETFGCEPPLPHQEQLASRLPLGGTAPVWLNLEYLSAEAYVERSHRLPSRVSKGPLRGHQQWFFYPGFTPLTGGLLRETDLLQRQAAFDAARWLASPHLGLDTAQTPAQRRASLFCYEPDGLPRVLRQAGEDAVTSHWLVTPGRAALAVAAVEIRHGPPGKACHLHSLPLLTQHDFDHLLWACDLNFVRGEDSLVRALWAGQPFVWHIYPQDDEAHHAKLEAFLDWLQAPESLRAFHRAWNGIGPEPARWPGWAVVDSWRACVQAARQRLLAQSDLVTQLIGFVAEKR